MERDCAALYLEEAVLPEEDLRHQEADGAPADHYLPRHGHLAGRADVGCPCAVCSSADPRDKRTRSSIYVSTPECAWVIDTGPEFRIQCLREKIDRIDAVVYTHSHTDHMMGFDDLRPFCAEWPRAARVCVRGDHGGFAAHLQLRLRRAAISPGYVKPRPHFIDGPFKLGGILLTPLPLKHGRAQVNGYLFESRGPETRRVYERLQGSPGGSHRAHPRRRGAHHRCAALRRASDTSERQRGAGGRRERPAAGHVAYAHLP